MCCSVPDRYSSVVSSVIGTFAAVHESVSSPRVEVLVHDAPSVLLEVVPPAIGPEAVGQKVEGAVVQDATVSSVEEVEQGDLEEKKQQRKVKPKSGFLGRPTGFIHEREDY